MLGETMEAKDTVDLGGSAQGASPKQTGVTPPSGRRAVGGGEETSVSRSTAFPLGGILSREKDSSQSGVPCGEWTERNL